MRSDLVFDLKQETPQLHNAIHIIRPFIAFRNAHTRNNNNKTTAYTLMYGALFSLSTLATNSSQNQK